MITASIPLSNPSEHSRRGDAREEGTSDSCAEISASACSLRRFVGDTRSLSVKMGHATRNEARTASVYTNSNNAGQRSRPCIDYNARRATGIGRTREGSLWRTRAAVCGRTGLRPRFMPRSRGKLNISLKENSRPRVTPRDRAPNAPIARSNRNARKSGLWQTTSGRCAAYLLPRLSRVAELPFFSWII